MPFANLKVPAGLLDADGAAFGTLSTVALAPLPLSNGVGDLAAEGHLPPGLDCSRVSMEPPREAGHGDVTANAAMVLAKAAGVILFMGDDPEGSGQGGQTTQ